jgi:membrane fusion protein (multidrug efflux system)
MPRRLLLLVVPLCLVLAAGGYWYLYGVPGFVQDRIARLVPRPTPAQGPTPPAQPPPEVGVIAARAAEVPVPVEYPGRVEGFRVVEVRARVGGLLLRREYEEGATVKADQVLFRIDPATYQVALDRAQAQLAQAQATLRQAEQDYARIGELARGQVAATQQLDQALAQRDQTRAAVQLAEAEVASARLNLDYTTITAPLTGVTALQSPPMGTLIQAEQSLLTTITQLDPAYVTFSFTDAEGQAFRELNQRRAVPIRPEDLTVELHYGNGTAYPSPGRIDTAAQKVDLQTGTIQARAIFPNPDGAILPGQFVRVVIRGVTLPDAIVVPDRAVSQGPQGPSVFVVGANDTAQARPVRLGTEVAQGWVVEQGLQAGDRVVVDGIIRVRPGAPVRPVPVDNPAQASAADASRTTAAAGGAGTGP